MASTVSIVVSVVALGVSLITAWLTLLRRGTVRMTQPTTIFFGPDGDPSRRSEAGQKVFLRSLLYATSKRGRIVESMFLRLRRGESSQNFNIWVYGDRELARGSGLHVGEDGVVANHHFLAPPDGSKFEFLPGEYRLDVHVSLVGGRETLRLFSTTLPVTPEHAKSLRDSDNGLYFDWGPDSASYQAHLRTRPKPDVPQFFKEVLQGPGFRLPAPHAGDSDGAVADRAATDSAGDGEPTLSSGSARIAR